MKQDENIFSRGIQILKKTYYKIQQERAVKRMFNKNTKGGGLWWKKAFIEEGNIVKLDVGGLDLNSSFPKELFKLKELRSLRLYNCSINEIPSQIGELKNLQNLDLSRNELNSIPSQIGELKNLQNLDLSRNELNSIPSQIGELKNLQNLDLSRNKLFSIPIELFNCHSLKNMNFSKNYISGSFPLGEDIEKLEKIEKINLGGNEFTGVYPKIDFDKVRNLKTICLGDTYGNDLHEMQDLERNEYIFRYQSYYYETEEIITIDEKEYEIKNRFDEGFDLKKVFKFKDDYYTRYYTPLNSEEMFIFKVLVKDGQLLELKIDEKLKCEIKSSLTNNYQRHLEESINKSNNQTERQTISAKKELGSMKDHCQHSMKR